MKTRKRSNFFAILYALSIVITTTNCMEQAQPNKWTTGVAIIGSILLGTAALKTLWQQHENFPFTDLPQDIQREIITLLALNTQAKTLDEAVKPLRALSMTNKQLHELFNNKNFTDTLINHLSQKFDEGYLSTAKALATPTAKQLYDEENIKISNAKDLMNSIYKNNSTLFNATIQKPNISTGVRVFQTQYTALMLSVSLPKNQSFHDFPLSEATIKRHYQWCYENNITQRLLQHNTQVTTINQKDFAGNTALLLALIECAKQQNKDLIKPSIKVLLDFGANPHLTNNNGLTPLQAAINTGDNELIDLIKSAITNNK